MRLVFSFLKPYRSSMIIALALMLTELMVELWHPLLLAKVIDEGILKRDMAEIVYWGALMIVISLLGFASGIVNSFFAARVSQGFGTDIRKSLFRKLQSLPYDRFARFPTSTLITRLTSDVTQLQHVVFAGLRIMMRAPLFMVFGVVMALSVHFRLSVVLLVVIPLLMLFMVWMMKKGFALFRAVQERLDDANGILRENLMGMRLIKAFVRDRYETGRFTAANSALTERTASALRFVELLLPLMLLVMNLSILVILWVGSREIGENGAQLGQMVAVVNYAVRITGSFSVLSMIITSLSRGRASAGRIAEVLAITDAEQGSEWTTTVSSAPGQPVGPAAAPSAAGQLSDPAARSSAPGEPGTDRVLRGESPQRSGGQGQLVFDRVSFRYPEVEGNTLHSISFAAAPGETVALIGATGSGKSTVFQLIPRLYEVSGGSIEIDGTDIRETELEWLRGSIGYVPQEAVLFTGTVKDNLLRGKEDATMEEVIEAATIAQIHETIMKLPQQYETMIGQKGVNLSGGQKQRLSIARALLRKPKLLLLDDCTSALDLKTEAKLMQAIHKSCSCTTLIITQKISTAMKADAVLLLDEGRLLAAGSHRRLLRESELYRRIVKSQDRGGEESYA